MGVLESAAYGASLPRSQALSAECLTACVVVGQGGRWRCRRRTARTRCCAGGLSTAWRRRTPTPCRVRTTIGWRLRTAASTHRQGACDDTANACQGSVFIAFHARGSGGSPRPSVLRIVRARNTICLHARDGVGLGEGVVGPVLLGRRLAEQRRAERRHRLQLHAHGARAQRGSRRRGGAGRRGWDAPGRRRAWRGSSAYSARCMRGRPRSDRGRRSSTAGRCGSSPR